MMLRVALVAAAARASECMHDLPLQALLELSQVFAGDAARLKRRTPQQAPGCLPVGLKSPRIPQQVLSVSSLGQFSGVDNDGKTPILIEAAFSQSVQELASNHGIKTHERPHISWTLGLKTISILYTQLPSTTKTIFSVGPL